MRPALYCVGERYANQRKEVQQTGHRQSDSLIVPKVGKPPEGSGERGVPRTPAMQNYIKKETLSVHRDRRNSGNEIGENIAVVKRKPGHGIYKHWPSDKQGTVKGVP